MTTDFYVFVIIAVYLFTAAVIYLVFRDRMREIETEYRFNFNRVCSTFVYTMQTVTQALQAQQAEDETEEDEAPALDPEDEI
jgi:hypothetical protein